MSRTTNRADLLRGDKLKVSVALHPHPPLQKGQYESFLKARNLKYHNKKLVVTYA